MGSMKLVISYNYIICHKSVRKSERILALKTNCQGKVHKSQKNTQAFRSWLKICRLGVAQAILLLHLVPQDLCHLRVVVVEVVLPLPTNQRKTAMRLTPKARQARKLVRGQSQCHSLLRRRIKESLTNERHIT